MEWFKAFYLYLNLKDQFQILNWKKSDVFYVPRLLGHEKNYIWNNKFLTM